MAFSERNITAGPRAVAALGNTCPGSETYRRVVHEHFAQDTRRHQIAAPAGG
jgi:hypothetical protein